MQLVANIVMQALVIRHILIHTKVLITVAESKQHVIGLSVNMIMWDVTHLLQGHVVDLELVDILLLVAEVAILQQVVERVIIAEV